MSGTQHCKASTAYRVKRFESLLIDSSNEETRYIHNNYVKILKEK